MTPRFPLVAFTVLLSCTIASLAAAEEELNESDTPQDEDASPQGEDAEEVTSEEDPQVTLEVWPDPVGGADAVSGDAQTGEISAMSDPVSELRCEEERCLDDHPVAEAAGPWSLGASLAFGFGLVRPNGKVRFFVGRRFRDRISVELEGALAVSRSFIDLEVTSTVGILVHISRRIDLEFLGRLGYAGFFLYGYEELGLIPTLTTSLGANLRILLHRRVELRIALLVVTGFWNQFWGVGAEPALALATRF